jgi:hypothetical protein
MLLYQYLFYYIHKGYIEAEEKSVPGFYAIAIISMLICFNILSFCIIVYLLLLNGTPVFINGISSGMLFFSVLLINYLFFYRKNGKKKAIDIFSKADKKTIQKLRFRAIAYITASVIIMFLSLFGYIKYGSK